MHTQFSLESPKDRDNLEDVGTDEILLEQILEKQGVG